MASSSLIIRVPRTDQEGAYILGEVTSTGSKPLNVKLVATEGEEPYAVKCKLSFFPRYKTKISQWCQGNETRGQVDEKKKTAIISLIL